MMSIRGGAVGFALAVMGCASGAGESSGREPSAGSTSSEPPASTSETSATSTDVAATSTGEPALPTTGDGTSSSSSSGDTTTGATTSGSSSGETTDTSTGAAPFCGDASIDAPDELCDDGNAVDGDGCNSDCKPSGQLLWSTTYGGMLGLADDGIGCAVDGTGSIYVTGSVGVAVDNDDLWLRKYSAEGAELWTHKQGGNAKVKDQGRSVVVDVAELVYVAGYINTLMQDNDVFVRKFAADGTPIWTKGYNGAAMLGDHASAAAQTPTGDVVVGGATSVAGAGADAWLRKYTPLGATSWTRTHAGASKASDEVNALAITADGYIYAAGVESVTGEGRNIWVGKFDPDGNELWSRLYNGGASKDDYLHGAVALPDGGVVVCGYETAIDIPYKSFMRRYDGAGLATWTEIEDGAEHAGAICYGVDLAANGDLIVAGAAIEATRREPRIRRMTVAGEPLWSVVIAGAGNGASQARCVRPAPDGTIAAAGSQDDGVDGRDVWVARFSP